MRVNPTSQLLHRLLVSLTVPSAARSSSPRRVAPPIWSAAPQTWASPRLSCCRLCRDRLRRARTPPLLTHCESASALLSVKSQRRRIIHWSAITINTPAHHVDSETDGYNYFNVALAIKRCYSGEEITSRGNWKAPKLRFSNCLALKN